MGGPFVRVAETSGDLRAALRWRHRMLLEHLDRAGIIDLRLDKTNRVYLSEIGDPNLRTVFREATRLFEQSWYGGTAPERTEYDRLVNRLRPLQESGSPGAREEA